MRPLNLERWKCEANKKGTKKQSEHKKKLPSAQWKRKQSLCNFQLNQHLMDHPTPFCCFKRSLGNVGVFACRLAERPMYLKRSRQQLNNLYWVTYKSFICCDQVQLEFEPWTDEARNGEIYFQIKVSHNRKDLVGWLLSFISNHEINWPLGSVLKCLYMYKGQNLK